MEHQHQEKLPDQVAANISFSFTIPAIALKEEVNRANEEGSCEDEGTEVTNFQRFSSTEEKVVSKCTEDK